jgi:hypothetical protein
VDGGELFEQTIQIEQDGALLSLRRIVLRLAKPTRHEETELVFLSNLPIAAANAVVIAQLYRERWQVEHLFLTVTMNFEAEIKTLAYPKAALFSFSLALVCYNILATIRAALAEAHGVETINQELSDFYLVDEIQATYRGMMIAIPPEHWQLFQPMTEKDLATQLKTLAQQVNLKRFRKQPRKSKTKTKKRVSDPKHPHVSTAKLLSPD